MHLFIYNYNANESATLNYHEHKQLQSSSEITKHKLLPSDFIYHKITELRNHKLLKHTEESDARTPGYQNHF